MIKGLWLPNDTFLRDMCFVDDITLYLYNMLKNLQRTFNIIESFYRASNFLINWIKSKAIWIYNSHHQ